MLIVSLVLRKVVIASHKGLDKTKLTGRFESRKSPAGKENEDNLKRSPYGFHLQGFPNVFYTLFSSVLSCAR